jgi:hypothetical protein
LFLGCVSTDIWANSEEVTADWRKIHKLHNLTFTKYYFGNQTMVNEMGRGQVPHSGKNRNTYRVLVGNFKDGDRFEDSGTVGMMILKCT